MRYWFTTHWPALPDGRDIMNLYLQDQHRDIVDGMAGGDRILIYEFAKGPDLLKANGVILRRGRGRQGIVCEGKIVEGLRRRPLEEAHEVYTNGKVANWTWSAGTGDRTYGYLPRARVNDVLGYAEGYNYFGFNRGRGAKEIRATEYARLMEKFVRGRSSRGEG